MHNRGLKPCYDWILGSFDILSRGMKMWYEILDVIQGNFKCHIDSIFIREYCFSINSK